jgi:hypothetical protein
MDLFEKLNADHYCNRREYPDRKDPLFEKLRQAYAETNAALSEQFKADLFAHYEVTDHPKREAAYRIAYEHGHSAGYSEVANYFGELVELLK